MMASSDVLIKVLRTRFHQFMHRHADINWYQVEDKLLYHPDKLKIIQAMEETGGEPDVIGIDEQTGEFLFCDCSAESPVGRRSLCYDEQALKNRKANKPNGSVEAMASKIGITLLNEEDYRALQRIGPFDQKTSSWIATPIAIRKLGGALFGDFRYGTTFIYHNGAESYYSSRGFRGKLSV